MYNPPPKKDLLDAVPAKFKNDNSMYKEALSRSTCTIESSRARLFPDSIVKQQHQHPPQTEREGGISSYAHKSNYNPPIQQSKSNSNNNTFNKIKVNKNKHTLSYTTNNNNNIKPSSYKNIPNFHAHRDNVKDIFNSKIYNNIKEQDITQNPNKNSFSDISLSARQIMQERYQ